MGILDEAIREHLELKRQHGAEDSELKQLEDEAFGQAERPGSEPASDAAAEAPTEFMAQPEAPEEPAVRREPTIADLQEPPPAPVEADDQDPAPAGTSAEERQEIAEQPTELHDVEAELGAEEPPSPTDEELVEEEIAEPRLSSADPIVEFDEDEEAEVIVQGPAPDDDEEYEDEDDAFWNEQRLSDELDQALEAPSDREPDEPEKEEPEAPTEPARTTPHHDDVLDETPEFLEESPEDDQLWFEQKPPKDFDFDD